MIAAPDRNILLAFDFGLRRIGVATANLLTETATPLTTIDNGRNLPWAAIDPLLDEWRPGRLVVGQPDPDTASAVAELAAQFALELGRRYGLPVDTIDEALTSKAAESELREARKSGIMNKRMKKQDIDSQAACLIARQWIGAHGKNQTAEPRAATDGRKEL